jgi:hypothetical protein
MAASWAPPPRAACGTRRGASGPASPSPAAPPWLCGGTGTQRCRIPALLCGNEDTIETPALHTSNRLPCGLRRAAPGSREREEEEEEEEEERERDESSIGILYTKTSMVASRSLWQQEQRLRNSSPATNTRRPLSSSSWHLAALAAAVAGLTILTADFLSTADSCCFLGDGWMMRRSPTSCGSPAGAAIAAGAEVEARAPTPSSRRKRPGALGIITLRVRDLR